MTDQRMRLDDELERIIHSPYPTQLKSLRDVLYDGYTRHAIDKSLQNRICQLDHLAECLLEGLKTWPYVLEIITSLSSNVAFRDALLRCEPRLLPDLLNRATSEGGLNGKYSQPAVALLSHPLPDDHPLPASAQILFLRLIQYATQHPSASALRPVCALLRGVSTLLVGLLSSATLSEFEEQLGDVLRSNHVRSAPEAGDQLRTLHCLAIMQNIVEGYSERRTASASFYETQDLLASTQTNTPCWSPENMQNFFCSTNKAPKTVQLVVLQAIWACQAHDVSYDDRMTTLSLSNHIMAAVPSDIRDAWCASNPTVAQKLQQKVLACQDSTLELVATAFVCRLCKPVMLQSSLVEDIRQTCTNLTLLNQLSRLDLEDGLACFLPLLDRETIQELCRRILDVLVGADQTALHTTFRTCQTVVRALSQSYREGSVVEDVSSDIFLDGLTGPKVEELLANLSSKASARPSEHSARACKRSLDIAHNEASRDYVSLLLNLSIHVSKDEYHIGSTMESLILIHALSAEGSIPCHHARYTASDPTSPVELAQNDDLQQDGHQDWRQALKDYSTSNARKAIQGLTELFGRACSDLEARCEHVEQPLAEEMSARLALQEESDALQQAYDDLEAQHLDRKLHQDGLEAENNECRGTLEAAQDENEELLGKVSSLQRQLKDNQDDFKEQLATIMATKESAELERAAVSAKMQENREEMQERSAEFTRRLTAQSLELEQLRVCNAAASAARDEARARTEAMQSDLHEKDEELRTSEVARIEAEAHRIHLESDLHATNQDLEQAKGSHEREVEAMREVVRQNSKAANASHNHALDRMASQHGGEVAGLEERVTEGLQQIKKLEKNCRQKDAQIAEANALRVQLLATLGGGGGGGARTHLLPPDTQSQTQSQTQMSMPYRTRSPTKTDMRVTQQDHSILPFSQSFDGAMDDANSQIFNDGHATMHTSFASTGDSSTSAHNAGPTPKRARPRRSIKASVPSTTARTSKTVGMSRVASRKTGSAVQDSTKRKPLGGLHVNVSPRKEMGGDCRTPSKGGRQLDIQGFGDSMMDD
ncbi:hypothetical protein LTR78_005758 [Recurvomyces mirabilis]|uniref:Uncharacterized protein n=1 Tax=Recurvomyces mirabilis TaxID=574656 RepID=A0AAE1C0X7_9PEZI|nr:hypothetical protein LTR78_005758 [Recurvomyces mirabilis]KAK5154137.1 hypothetical protein LTS14_006822 [Recurvomyces mirabilis]